MDIHWVSGYRPLRSVIAMKTRLISGLAILGVLGTASAAMAINANVLSNASNESVAIGTATSLLDLPAAPSGVATTDPSIPSTPTPTAEPRDDDSNSGVDDSDTGNSDSDSDTDDDDTDHSDDSDDSSGTDDDRHDEDEDEDEDDD